jgi:integrase
VAIHDRWLKDERGPDGKRTGKQVRTTEYGCERRWQVRWRDETGRQRKESFAKKATAEQFDAKVKTQLAEGSYVDPSAGDVSFRAYTEEWRKGRVHDDATAERMETAYRNHAYAAEGTPGRTATGGPAIGDFPMRTLAKRPSLIQAWIKGLALNANSAVLVIGYVSQVFTAAVEDGIIAKNPLSAKSIHKPEPSKTEAIPWTATQVAAVARELPDWLEVAPYIGSGLGARQGEAFGLAKPDLDFLRKNVRIAVQIKIVAGQQVFAPVKNKKPRDVPMAEPVIPRLAEHIRRFPPVAVTLPWHEPGNRELHGKLVTRELILTRPDGRQMHPEAFNRPWRTAWKKAGLPDRGRRNGFHATRHTFASACLSDGLNPAKVAALIGDTLQVTLETYSHFLPDDDNRAREILGRFFSPVPAPDPSACASDVPGAAR